jgi:hypothetical protein
LQMKMKLKDDNGYLKIDRNSQGLAEDIKLNARLVAAMAARLVMGCQN